MVASVAKGFVNTDLVFSTANEADFPGDLQILGLSDWGEDVVVGLFATRPAKYHMTEKLSHISLCQFIQDYLDGSQQPPQGGQKCNGHDSGGLHIQEDSPEL